jgi:cellulose synthase/poly-beta-1,6-N-acetylglucosamine synthase-like glycosyltransferase
MGWPHGESTRYVMQPTVNSVSVVVPSWSWDRRDHLGRCLRGIERQTLTPFETIVVIDHNPRLLEWTRESFPGMEVIANRHQRGVVGARNSGVDVAKGEVVVLTDDDTEAEPTWIERLASCFEDPEVVGVTGELLPDWAGPEPEWFPSEFYWVFGCSYTGLPTEVAPVRNPIGANMAVRTRQLREIGGFREGAAPREISYRGVVIAGGHALEDTELGIRIGQRWPEMSWLYQPNATVRHLVTEEQATLGYLMRRSFEEGSSKAHLAGEMGAQSGLSSERRYVSIVLPLGVLRGIRESLRGDRRGVLRSSAILVGLASSGIGFLSGILSRIWQRRG